MKRLILLALALCGSIGCVTKSEPQASAPSASGEVASNASKEEILKRIQSAEQSMKELDEKAHDADTEVAKAAMKNWLTQFNTWHQNQNELVKVNEKLGIKESPKVPSEAERTELESQVAATAAIVLSLNQKMAYASGSEKADFKLQALYNEKRIQVWEHQLNGKLH